MITTMMIGQEGKIYSYSEHDDDGGDDGDDGDDDDDDCWTGGGEDI